MTSVRETISLVPKKFGKVLLKHRINTYVVRHNFCVTKWKIYWLCKSAIARSNCWYIFENLAYLSQSKLKNAVTLVEKRRSYGWFCKNQIPPPPCNTNITRHNRHGGWQPYDVSLVLMEYFHSNKSHFELSKTC